MVLDRTLRELRLEVFMFDALFTLLSMPIFHGAYRQPGVVANCNSVLSFGFLVSPLVLRSDACVILNVTDEGLAQLIDDFHLESTFAVEERGQYLTMSYSGAIGMRSMAE